jgi:hypothetical protein
MSQEGGLTESIKYRSECEQKQQRPDLKIVLWYVFKICHVYG